MAPSATNWHGRIAGLVSIMPVLLALFWALEVPQLSGILLFPEQIASLILTSAVAAIYL
jgi:hypothetical protein